MCKYERTAAKHNMKYHRLKPIYANAVIKMIKLYMNCGIISVMMSIILSIVGNFLSTAQKYNRQNFEHNISQSLFSMLY